MRSFGGVLRATALVMTLTLLALLFSIPVSAAGSSPIPADVRLVNSWTDPLTGLRWDRYQQYAAPLNVFVDGGQIIAKVRGSTVVEVSGKHYPNLRVSTAPALSGDQAISAASAQSAPSTVPSQGSAALTHSAQLRVDPALGSLFYRVTSAAPGTVIYQDVDANTGAVLQTWSGIETNAPSGTGVKGDNKSLAGDVLSGATALTTLVSGLWRMNSADGRFVTVDANNTSSYPTTPMTDADGNWVGAKQIAAVDAQYYAALTDNFYRTKFNFDLTDPDCLGDNVSPGRIRSVVHYSHNYANAYWDPDARVMVYGDGNGSTFSQMSGAQDVVSHELSHAVTSCNSNLDYMKESGALNEAFSDIMGTVAEHEMLEPNTSNCRRELAQATCFDWWLAEDLIIGGSNHALRSLANPALLGQPSHYSQRIYQGNCTPNPFTNDECGVHTNSGIANHAFYLLAQGGRNARCSGPTDPQADCDVLVPGIGVDHAASIFLRGWFKLLNTSNFCDARTSSITEAQGLVDAPTAGFTQADVAATELAWDAVGVYCPPDLTKFSIAASTRSAAASPGGSAQIALTIARHSSTDTISFSVDDPGPATPSFTPASAPNGTNATMLQLDVPNGATAGLYPMTVTATGTSTTQKVALVLIVDDDLPTAQVGAVILSITDVVSADGHVPLHVTWTTSDATSGVASGGLSADSTSVATGVSGSATFASADGTHVFQASATDQAGNSASSDPVSVTQSSAQESAAVLTKLSKWIASTTANPWGTTLFSKTKGATATYQFTGTDVAWVSATGPKRGKAKVYIDGTLQTVVDLHAATSKSSAIVFVASGLSAGPHTIKVYVNGTTGRPRVDVDGFVVLSP